MIAAPNTAAKDEPNYQIAFAKFAPMNTDIFTADANGSNAKLLLAHPESDYNASFSPDGKWIFFTLERNGSADIYRVSKDGKNLERLTNAPGNGAHCSWSPDGKWIAFAGARGGFKDESVLHPLNPQPYGEIYVMRADGSDVRMLTDDQFEAATPAWIPFRH